MSEWEIIDTAPKDGTPVLVIHENYGNHRIGIFKQGKWGVGWEGEDWSFNIDFDPQPTHWTALPLPPK